ncbi:MULTISPECIES: RHS repeat-associated core domain-containing protein [Agrobacterium]|uniref:Wall-associated protein n=2 Tax=Agrobacterium TaxID=357 RepID=A0A9W5AY31_9HYPH
MLCDVVIRNLIGTPIATQAFLVGLAGRECEPETGLSHYRSRAYDPSTGRFLQEDPIWFEAGDLNVYRYVWNSPANWTDLSGMSAASERVGLGAIAIGVQQGLTINRSVQVAVWVRRWSGTRYVLQQVGKEVTLQNKGLGCVIGLKLASIGATIEITL